MEFVPWQYIADWKCNTCGLCCKAYSVVLNFQEWLKIIRNHGVENTASSLNKLFIKRRDDGSCIFLHNFSSIHFCGLQRTKPKACKLWPFKIASKPDYGYANEAAYSYGEKRIFVYADPNCSGLRYGKPTFEFSNQILREFIEIALGFHIEQYKTTASLNSIQPYVKLRI